MREAFPDPSAFKKEEEFVYAAKITSVFKKVCVELFAWIGGHRENAQALQAKEKQEVADKFEIGRN